MGARRRGKRGGGSSRGRGETPASCGEEEGIEWHHEGVARGEGSVHAARVLCSLLGGSS
jgi:hypothetical protein